jgi:hypothetical protein
VAAADTIVAAAVASFQPTTRRFSNRTGEPATARLFFLGREQLLQQKRSAVQRPLAILIWGSLYRQLAFAAVASPVHWRLLRTQCGVLRAKDETRKTPKFA